MLDISKICHVILSLSTHTHIPPLASAGTQELTLSLAPSVTQKNSAFHFFPGPTFVSHYFHFKYHLNSATMAPGLHWEYSDSEVSPLCLIMKSGNPIF